MSPGPPSLASERIAILGAGRLGAALARGFVDHGGLDATRILLCRRDTAALETLRSKGHPIEEDAVAAVRGADIVFLAVQPGQVDGVLERIAPWVVDRAIIVTLATNVPVSAVRRHLRPEQPVVRAMPNIGAALGHSMTCLAIEAGGAPRDPEALEHVAELFDRIGSTSTIEESMMEAATALAACGVAFFLRAIRAASQGGIQIGFHPEDALRMAARTAAGAAALALEDDSHPEDLIDQVTTPRGCTISGLNEMEHAGFSSAFVKGILTAANRASGLYEA